MKTFIALTKRNCKLFFRDKGMFFTSLITPVILLVLYATFLRNVFESSFASSIPEGFQLSEKLIDGLVSGQLVSSLLAVSCVTVAFCSNLLMVQDKISGAIRDITMTPVKSSTVALSYFFASAISTLIVCFTALTLCLIYLAATGWYLSAIDVLLLVLDIIMLVLFGTALSSIINAPLKTNGQGSAVGTIISAGYGFICGAYMPLYSFSEGLRNALCFLPGTYGTSIVRNHAMRGALAEMSTQGVQNEVIEAIKDSVDCNLYFFGTKVDIPIMYLIVFGTIAILIGAYVLMQSLHKNAK